MFASLDTSVQAPLHIIRGAVQVVVPPVQAPDVHVWPTEQRTPQPPQLMVSLDVSTQVPLHIWRGLAQVGALSVGVTTSVPIAEASSPVEASGSGVTVPPPPPPRAAQAMGPARLAARRSKRMAR